MQMLMRAFMRNFKIIFASGWSGSIKYNNNTTTYAQTFTCSILSKAAYRCSSSALE